MLIDKNTHEGFGICIGDGSIYCNGKCELDVNPPNNAPDYLAYYLERDDNFSKLWNCAYRLQISYPLVEVSITTDGIKSFKKLNGTITEKEIVDILLNDDKFVNFESMLERKCNILQHVEKINHTDDLSIIKVIL